MNSSRALVALGIPAATGLLLTACSLDTLIWGPDGGRVIDTTDRIIRSVQAGETDVDACADATVDIGDPLRWEGLSAGEPERLTGDYWKEQHAAGATWTINLEGLDPTTAQNGGEYPSVIFYSGDDEHLCVSDIEWGTVSF